MCGEGVEGILLWKDGDVERHRGSGEIAAKIVAG
jgi:hypothetical protein